MIDDSDTTRRLTAAFRAIAEQVRGDGWRLYADEGSVVQREAAGRSYFCVFRKLAEGGSVETVRVRTTIGHCDSFDLDTFVSDAVRALRTGEDATYVLIDRLTAITHKDCEKAYGDGVIAGKRCSARYVEELRERIATLQGEPYACSHGISLDDGSCAACGYNREQHIHNPGSDGRCTLCHASLAKETTTTTFGDLIAGGCVPGGGDAGLHFQPSDEVFVGDGFGRDSPRFQRKVQGKYQPGRAKCEIATDSCPSCGVHHPLDEHPVGAKRWLRLDDHRPARVLSWSQYGGPLSYRVELLDQNDEFGQPVRINCRPCELDID